MWKGRNDQSWKKVLKKVTESNHRAILAAPWYLNVIRYGVDWDTHYIVEPTDFEGTEEQKKRIIGGSAAMWGEYVDGTNILSRTWPRASAVGKSCLAPMNFLLKIARFSVNYSKIMSFSPELCRTRGPYGSGTRTRPGTAKLDHRPDPDPPKYLADPTKIFSGSRFFAGH